MKEAVFQLDVLLQDLMQSVREIEEVERALFKAKEKRDKAENEYLKQLIIVNLFRDAKKLAREVNETVFVLADKTGVNKIVRQSVIHSDVEYDDYAIIGAVGPRGDC